MRGLAEPVHIINPMWDAAGGAEHRAANLRKEIAAIHPAILWSDFKADPRFAETCKVVRTRPWRFHFPKRGTFVFVGVYFPIRRWIALTAPRRIILVYNTVDPDALDARVKRLSRIAPTEIVYTSEALRAASPHPGIFEPSLIDTNSFAPLRERPDRPFTVGRMSRAVEAKHHPADAGLYRMLAANGCEVRIMGAPDALRDSIGGAEGVRLYPAVAEPPEVFLRGLDCFYYRTRDNWFEPWGRVVTEAMATGLPVVCHRNGGYADIIRHGHNGFLFDSQEEAAEILLELKRNAPLRMAVGNEARRTVETLWSPDRRREIVEYYVR